MRDDDRKFLKDMYVHHPHSPAKEAVMNRNRYDATSHRVTPSRIGNMRVIEFGANFSIILFPSDWVKVTQVQAGLIPSAVIYVENGEAWKVKHGLEGMHFLHETDPKEAIVPDEVIYDMGG